MKNLKITGIFLCLLFFGVCITPFINGIYGKKVENLSIIKNQSAINLDLIANWSFNDESATDNSGNGYNNKIDDFRNLPNN